jgi:hypothetical protein
MVGLEPNFFIVGAGRSGTTALAEMLRQHDDIFVTDPKEPNFLALAGMNASFEGPGDDTTANRSSVTEPEAYRALYRHANGARARGDASVSSLFYPEAAVSTIERLFPEARVVVLLREPVARAYSAYSLLRMRAFEPCESFGAAIDHELSGARETWRPIWHYVEMGFYARQLVPYLERIGPERIQILFYDELVADPVGLARRVFRHIGVDDAVEVSPDLVNASGKTRSIALQRAIHWGAQRPKLRAAVRSTVPYRLRERVRRLNVRRDPMPSQAVDRLARMYEPELVQLRRLLECYYGEGGLTLPSWLDVGSASVSSISIGDTSLE